MGKAAKWLAFGVAVVVGAAAGYVVATNPELRTKIKDAATTALDMTREKAAGMSEDVVLKTAKLTGNPRFNQEWVANQWESVGY